MLGDHKHGRLIGKTIKSKEFTSLLEAQKEAATLTDCIGFTFEGELNVALDLERFESAKLEIEAFDKLKQQTDASLLALEAKKPQASGDKNKLKKWVKKLSGLDKQAGKDKAKLDKLKKELALDPKQDKDKDLEDLQQQIQELTQKTIKEDNKKQKLTTVYFMSKKADGRVKEYDSNWQTYRACSLSVTHLQHVLMLAPTDTACPDLLQFFIRTSRGIARHTGF
jgi:hypothetical protein